MIEATNAWKQRSCVIGLLVAFALLALCSVREKSGTYDELFHITGGYSYWKKGDYRIHNTNGNLVQRWIALPLLATDLTFPATDSLRWYQPGHFGYGFGKEFFFELGNDSDAMLRNARWMIVGLGVLLGYVVYRWSTRLFGRRAGLISLTLFAFSPSVIAHSQIATSDCAAALGFTLSTWCMWKVLHRLSPATLAASCLVVGLTAVVKFSAPLLVFIGLAIAGVRLARNRTWAICLGRSSVPFRSRRRSLVLMLGLGLAHVLVAAVVIWACYGFRYSGFSEFEPGRDEYSDPWSMLMQMRARRAARIIEFCREHQLLPEAYLYGMAHTLRFSEQRAAYLLGEFSMTGWRHYHPYCYFAKTTLSTHAMTLLGFSALLLRWRRKLRQGWRVAWLSLYSVSPLVTLLAVYWFVAIHSNLNLGVRHVLPVYPAMFILAGASILWVRRQGKPISSKKQNRNQVPTASRGRTTIMSWAIGILLALHVLDSLLTYPNYLAYFSPAVGGPSQGYKQLVDSNLDWGQDLPGLAKWQQENETKSGHQQPIYLEYVGTSSADHYGIVHIPLRDYICKSVTQEEPYPLRGGTFCISATVLASPNEMVTEWSHEYEQRLKAFVRVVRLAQDRDLPDEERELNRMACGNLQFARLLAYLREREPDERINYSLHIYHLTDQDIADAMHGPLKELNP